MAKLAGRILSANTALSLGGPAFEPRADDLAGSGDFRYGRWLNDPFLLTGQNYVGGPGNDIFVDFNGIADTYDGAGGTDTIDYSQHSSNLNVYLDYFGPEQGRGINGDLLISIENVITGIGNDFVRGSVGNNRIETGAGNDWIETFGGTDTLLGGAGDDTYYGAIDDDTIIELTGEGTDLIRLATGLAAFTIPANVENLSYEGGTGADLTGNTLNNDITGSSGNDRIYGMGGNDTLDGLGGYDELYGGPGDDLYRIRQGYDESGLIVELANEGIDTISTNLPSFTLPDNVENLIGGAYAVGPTIFGNTLTGNALANTITGSESHDTIYGMDGDDTIDGGLGNDTIYGGNGNDALRGYTGANLLYGEEGDDTLVVAVTSNNLVLDGGAGYDILDLWVSGSFSGQISSIESVRFTNTIVDLTLTAQQAIAGLASNVLFTGGTGAGRIVVNLGAGEQFDASAYQFAGNIFSFTINGTGGNEVIRGPGNFASTLNGGGGADTIYGGAQDDTVTGGTGADTLFGGGGTDRLNAEVGDALVDGGAGFDTLAYSASGTVTGTLANLEYFLVLGGASISLTAAQLIAGFGSTGSFSGTGAITINMAPGDLEFALSSYSYVPGSNLTMTINGSSSGEIIKGIGGTLNTINAGGGDDQVRGNSFSDTINGGDGDDKIVGAGGPDILTGGAGADTFRFQAASHSGLGAAADRVTDFVIGTDKLAFVAIDADAITPGDQAFSFLGMGAFSGGGAGSIRYQNSGADLLVQVDVDGNGTADMEIVLQGLNGQTLTAADFVL